MYFYEKYFLGVEISVRPPNLPQIEKIQNVTKFCSKMSNYWFFENNPKNKGLCRETIWCVFLSKFVFTNKKWCIFTKKYFFGCRNFCETSKFAPKLRKFKMWLNSAVKCQIICFFENNPKNKGLCRETIWCVFLSKMCFHKQKVMYFHEEIFFGCINFCETSKFAPIWENSKMWLNSAVKMSNYFFFENKPKNKSLCRDDDMVRFSVKNCFHKQKVMYFHEKYFLGLEISVGPPNLPPNWENPKCD